MVLSQKSIYTSVTWQRHRKQNRALPSDEHQHLFRASHQMTLGIKEVEKVRTLRTLPVDL